MIQELFGGGSAPNGLLGHERKISIPFSSPPSQTCPSSTPILTTNSIPTTQSSNSSANPPNSSNAANNNTTTNNNNNSENNNPSQQNLRCPRCDSTNTKFCYYNNYNLTQPRHFCKTCRRYWTKGGTLRNVPIGGGCRKNKSTASATASSATSGFTKSSSNAMAKAKATLSTELLVNGGNPGFLGPGLMDHHPDLQQSNPILWPSLHQNSHILSLLRGSSNHFHNPNPNPNNPNNPMSNVFTAVKTEGNNNNSSSITNLGLDSYGNGAPSLLGSFPRSTNQQANGFSSELNHQDYAQNGNNNNNSSNIIELYQRLKSSSSSNYNNNYCGNENQGTVIFGNMMAGSASSTPSSPMHTTNILDSAPVGVGVGGGDSYGGGYSFMSSSGISGWSDFPTVPINGAYP